MLKLLIFVVAIQTKVGMENDIERGCLFETGTNHWKYHRKHDPR